MDGCNVALATPPPLRPAVRPKDTVEWSGANVSAIVHRRFLVFSGSKERVPWFSPVATAQDGWAAAIQGSQHPRTCGRALLFEDDLRGVGLGFTLPFVARLLMIAMRESRVLMEVPVDRSWGQSNQSEPQEFTARSSPHRHRAATAPRWCRHPPHTLGCFFKGWTHCAVPPEKRHVAPSLRAGTGRIQHWPNVSTPVVRLKLSWLYQSWWLFMYRNSTAWDAAMRFLTRPRAWVARLGSCVMRRSGLLPQRFVAVHLRSSAEKAKELQDARRSMPPPTAYPLLVEAASAALSGWLSTPDPAAPAHGTPPPVFVQSASASAIDAFAAATRTLGLKLSFTRHPRSDHDDWGGWSSAADPTFHGTVAAVNAWVASHAAALISLAASAWTDLLVQLMHAPPAAAADAPSERASEATKATVAVCCQCARRKEAHQGNMLVAFSRRLFTGPAAAQRREALVERLVKQVAARTAGWTNPAAQPGEAGGPRFRLLGSNVTCIWARWRP
jgi:hypothetical protein